MTVYLAPREASPPSQSWELSEVAEGGGRARGRPLRRGEARRGCRQGRSMLSPRIRQARRGESSGGAGPHRETSPGGRGEGAAAAEAPGNKRWVGGRGLDPRWSAVPGGIEALDSDLGLGGVSAPLWGLLMLRLSCRNSCWRQVWQAHLRHLAAAGCWSALPLRAGMQALGKVTWWELLARTKEGREENLLWVCNSCLEQSCSPARKAIGKGWARLAWRRCCGRGCVG